MNPRVMTFGRYSLVRRVGMGGMAEVWKAKMQGPAGFEKVVAIKRVLPQLVEDENFVSMFVEEAKLVARLVHPNIVPVIDFGTAEAEGEDGPSYFLTMEYVPGQNVASVLSRLQKQGTRLPLEVALYVVAESAKALAYAHSETDETGRPLSIVHRDVSPHNILVSYRGDVKVTDFGIAKVASAIPRTAAGMWKGKIAYMSPEQAQMKPLDRRSDLFSLATVLYELVTGGRLFSGSTSEEVFAKLSSFRQPSTEEIAALPEAVRSILMRGLALDPAARHQDGSEMFAAVSAALGTSGAATARATLASLLQTAFEPEYRREFAVSPASETQANAEQLEPWMQQIRDHEQAQDPTRVPSGTIVDSNDAEQGGTHLAARSSDDPAHSSSDPAGTMLRVEPGQTRSAAPLSPVRGSDAEATLLRPQRGGDATALRPGTALLFDDPAATMIRPGAGTAAGMPAPDATLAGAPAIEADRSSSAPTRRRVFAMFALGGVAVLVIAGLFAARELVSARKPVEVVVTSPATSSVTSTSTPILSGKVEATVIAMATSPPNATPSPVSSRRATPRPTRRLVASTPGPGTSGSGWLTVRARPWVGVWIDGRKAADETPLKLYPLSAGPHRLRFANPKSNYSAEKSITISATKETEVFVDVTAAKIDVREVGTPPVVP